MARSIEAELPAFIEWVRNSESSSFYRDRWGGASIFEELPTISRSDFLATPISRRRYADEKALVKIVRTPKGMFASEWSFDDIAKEQWGPLGLRPLVYLSDPDETCEKAIWCYDQNRLPFAIDPIPEMAQGAAEWYRADSLICDTASLMSLRSYLEKRTIPLQNISVIDSSFDFSALSQFASYTERLHLTLSLPETGAFAHAPWSERLTFALLPNCVLEQGTVPVLTKVAKLTTPIVRYALPDVSNYSFE